MRAGEMLSDKTVDPMPDIREKKMVEAATEEQAKVIYDSPPSEADDDLWLTHGVKILEDSVPGLRGAASELLKSLGMLMTAYLAILGFAKFIPETMEVYNKALFVVPLIPWVMASYYALRVAKTELINVNLRSPSDIREKTSELLQEKQRYLEIAFALLVAGIILAFAMVVFRVRL